MSNFNDFINKKFNVAAITPKEEKETKTEEWIWVKGYKGTNKNMMCRDYQFEMDKTFEMPGDSVIELCKNGFHFCTKLKDVYSYYPIREGNRFFEVEAMVRKSEYDKIINKYNDMDMLIFSLYSSDSKLTAKSIRFIRELGRDEILSASKYDTSNWTEDQKDRALTEGVDIICDEIRDIEIEKERADQKVQLKTCGYCETLIEYIVTHDMFDIAYAVGCQEGLSMDMKVFAIFNHSEDED